MSGYTDQPGSMPDRLTKEQLKDAFEIKKKIEGVLDPLKALADEAPEMLPPVYVHPKPTEEPLMSPTVPSIDLTDKTKQIRDFFTKEHEDEKNYFKNMLANIPPNVPQWAIDGVRKKLEEMENNGPPQVTVEEGKVTRHTVEELEQADDQKIAKLSAEYTSHARRKLKGR